MIRKIHREYKLLLILPLARHITAITTITITITTTTTTITTTITITITTTTTTNNRNQLYLIFPMNSPSGC